jgi:hypothetical protein
MPKFKVHLTRMVEEVRTIEVTANDIGAAIAAAQEIAEIDMQPGAWMAGDEMESAEAYAAHDAAGALVWER